MKVISFVNQKGGVAKTTSCVNIGASLVDQGKCVLLIDLDAQGSLSIASSCGNLTDDDLTTYEVLKGADINEAIHHGRIDIIPTDIRLSGAEVELSSVMGREFLLRESLTALKGDYDYILIDCPPSLGILTLIALTASDELIIPVKADFYALNGMSQLLDTVNLIKKRLNSNLTISGVIATFYDGRRNLDQQVAQKIESTFPGQLFKTTISMNTRLAEAPANGVDIFKYDDTCKGAQQYESLTKEFIEREEK